MIHRSLPLSLLLILSLFFTSSCEKLSDLLKAEVVVSVPIDCVIPISSAGAVIEIEEWMSLIDLEDKIFAANNQLGTEDIQSISIQSAYISIPVENRLEDANLLNVSNPIIYFQSDAVREWKNIASWAGICESKFIQNLNVNTAQDWSAYFERTSRYNLKMTCTANTHISEPIRVIGEVIFILKVSA